MVTDVVRNKQFLQVDLSESEKYRIFSKIDKDKSSGCWTWKGYTVGEYGRFRYRGRTESIHRVMYAWKFHPLERGVGGGRKVLDHFYCNNKKCCNPDHLVLVEHRENVLRSDGPTTRNFNKKVCVRGHDLPSAPNDKQGKKRYCKKCSSILAKKYYLERIK